MTTGTTTTTRSDRPFSIRLTPDLKRRLRADAGLHDRSMNEHIAALLDEHLPPLQDLSTLPAVG